MQSVRCASRPRVVLIFFRTLHAMLVKLRIKKTDYAILHTLADFCYVAMGRKSKQYENMHRA